MKFPGKFNFSKSLKGRLAIYFTVAITVSLAISALLSIGLIQRYLKHRTISDLQSQAQTLAGQIESEGLPQRRYNIDLERMYGIRALIVPYKAQALSKLPGGGNGAQTPLSGPVPINWNQLIQGQTTVQQFTLPGNSRETVVVAHAFNAGGEPAGAVVLAKPVSDLQPWRPLAGWFIISAAISLAVSVLLAFLLARRLSRPLHEITQAATAVAAGDFSTRLNVRSEDEIGRLADAFRFMSDEVQKSQEQQRQFVINVSHELRTPLTAIAGHTQALREGIAEDPEAVASSLKVIGSETKRLGRLIEDLLSLAKFDARQFELRNTVVSVSDMIGDVMAGFGHEAGRLGVALTVGAAGEEIKLNTDPDRLRQILSNLVHNALHHTPGGGQVMIAGRRDEDAVRITVSDTGSGIGPDDLPHVFDRFYRASNGSDRKAAGLGLGLSISRELARAMGGDISVSSTPGEGSRFTLMLPAATEA